MNEPALMQGWPQPQVSSAIMESSREQEFWAAFCKAQSEIDFASKNAKNPHQKNRYADLASVIEAVKGPLNSNGISFSQLPATDIDVIEGQLFVETTTLLVHSNGYRYSGIILVPVKANPNAQDILSASTYGRRYGLQSMCGVPSDDDDGNHAAGVTGPKEQAPEANTELYNKYMDGILGAKDLARLDTLESALGKTSLSEDQKYKLRFQASKQASKLAAAEGK